MRQKGVYLMGKVIKNLLAGIGVVFIGLVACKVWENRNRPEEFEHKGNDASTPSRSTTLSPEEIQRRKEILRAAAAKTTTQENKQVPIPRQVDKSPVIQDVVMNTEKTITTDAVTDTGTIEDSDKLTTKQTIEEGQTSSTKQEESQK